MSTDILKWYEERKIKNVINSDNLKKITKISIDKYNDFTKKINTLCQESAKKGNVHLVINEKELNELDIPINEHTFITLKIFLQEEGFLVVTSYEEKKIEIYWVSSVISEKTNKILENYPSKEDNEVKKMLNNDESVIVIEKSRYQTIYNQLFEEQEERINNYEKWEKWDDDLYNIKNETKFIKPELVESESVESEEEEINSDDNICDIIVTSKDIAQITNMTEYVKSMIDKTNKALKRRDKERLVYEMYMTILKVEIDEPIKNNRIFKKDKYIDVFINKLNEMVLEDKMFWPNQMLVEFEEIKRNRFPNI